MNTAEKLQTVPEGYKRDGRGYLIPVEQIKAIDLQRDELVKEIVEKARVQSAELNGFKDGVFGDVDAFVQLSAERYGVKLGGQKGNLTLMSFDGAYKVLIANQETLVFDEGLQAAKALIDECLNEWTEGTRSELRTIINEAFDTDSEGRINARRVLAMRRYEIADARWKRAMDALSDSVRVQGSKRYLRVYERDADGAYQPIALDVAGA